MKLMAVQQHYKDSDFKEEKDEDEEDIPIAPVHVDSEEEKQPDEANQEEKQPEEDAEK